MTRQSPIDRPPLSTRLLADMPRSSPRCPECGELPAFVLAGGTQAFCGTESCTVLVWNSLLSADENRRDSTVIDLDHTRVPFGDETP